MGTGVVLLLLLLFALDRTGPQGASPPQRPEPSATGGAAPAVERFFAEGRSSVQVAARGVVVRSLPDDLEGSRHQRFVLRLESGHTVLVSHNIDLAPRVDGLRAGERAAVYGEYEWNERGGVIHWTHHDPAGRHPGGWVEYGGRRYQ